MNLYEGLRKRAREHGSSIAAEVISVLVDNISTATELALRRKFLKNVIRMRSRRPSASGPISSAAKLLRKDRLR